MSSLTKLNYGTDNIIEQRDFTSEVFVDFQNNRLKIVDYKGDLCKISQNAIVLCGKYGMGKIITTVPNKDKDIFIKNNFIEESKIIGYFRGTDGYNLSYFYDNLRGISDKKNEEDEIIKEALKNRGDYQPLGNTIYSIRNGTIEDAQEMAKLYDSVFKTYPTPMDNPEFIKNMIASDQAIFKVAELHGQIVSAASADLNHEYLNAEMTDCATLPNHRGKGLLSELIYYLEESLKEKDFLCLYSIARAISPGINIVFSKHNYTYTGRQIKNSQIMGKLEDMNIWVKNI